MVEGIELPSLSGRVPNRTVELFASAVLMLLDSHCFILAIIFLCESLKVMSFRLNTGQHLSNALKTDIQ